MLLGRAKDKCAQFEASATRRRTECSVCVPYRDHANLACERLSYPENRAATRGGFIILRAIQNVQFHSAAHQTGHEIYRANKVQIEKQQNHGMRPEEVDLKEKKEVVTA